MSSLREAVQAAVREAAAETGDRTDLLVSEFVVIATTNGWDEDGNEVSQVAVMPEDGSESRILGLIEHARVRMHADILSDYGG